MQEVNARVLGKGLELLRVRMVAGLGITRCYLQMIRH